MSGRVLLIPAAGMGSRLGASRPKLLVEVGGQPMLDRLRDLYAQHVARIVVVVHPSFERTVAAHVEAWDVPVATVVQERPTGMLDALLLARGEITREPFDSVWITWCDQVAVHPATVARLADTTAVRPAATLVLPTVTRRSPYIHFERDSSGRIVRVLHRREGDRMPEVGESDMGLFALTPHGYRQQLQEYAIDVAPGAATGERNFLPFISWLAGRGEVVTFPSVDDTEAVGVNTPEELALVERYLVSRASLQPAEGGPR
jgi:bifunctional N-acetylglucosamine-1-phosphate-uridyltransferase/glucosamine-1-phosphate-acetyltransferase GlmU-like protein